MLFDEEIKNEIIYNENQEEDNSFDMKSKEVVPVFTELVRKVKYQISNLKIKIWQENDKETRITGIERKEKNLSNKGNNISIQREDTFMQSQLKQQKTVKIFENLTMLPASIR